jgi:hypothetical protein
MMRAYARADVRIVAQPLVGRHPHLAPALVAQSRALHSQLPLGQRHHAALGTVPKHRATLAPTLLGACQLLRRQHQQLLDQRDGRLVHQFVDARLCSFDQLQHRQQRLAAAGQYTFDLRTVVAVPTLNTVFLLR